jgi:response regulator RpfG family c-di-GMP phosphodiesterase
VSERVLVIDDDEAIRLLIARMVEDTGHPVEAAADAAQARMWLAAARFALVICDLNMPGESGQDLVGWIRAHHPDVAVLIELAAQIARSHHEQFGGGGYPSGLRGEAIPLEGRITAVADVFDALTHDRVYRPAMPVDRALEILAAGRSSRFDPDILDTFMDSADDVLALEAANGGRPA